MDWFVLNVVIFIAWSILSVVAGCCGEIILCVIYAIVALANLPPTIIWLKEHIEHKIFLREYMKDTLKELDRCLYCELGEFEKSYMHRNPLMICALGLGDTTNYELVWKRIYTVKSNHSYNCLSYIREINHIIDKTNLTKLQKFKIKLAYLFKEEKE